MINKTVCITDVYDGPMPCVNPDITWIIPDSNCLSSPCDGCDDACINITTTEDCADTCVQVAITCPDCVLCEPVILNVCLCDFNSDCEVWEKCEDGICVDKCEKFHNEYGVCVDCLDNSHCQGDKVCNQGDCQCPPGTVDIGGNQCRECLVDSDCPDCEECVGIKCQPIDCPSACIGDECVECTHSGHCGPNEVCGENNICECAPGYTRDFESQQCLPVPTCEDSNDCGGCRECVGGNCVDKVCPEGYVCYNDQCVKLCNCLMPTCEANYECVNIGGRCICLPCEGECPEPVIPGQGTNPDPDNPNNPGDPCSSNSGCGPDEECFRGGCIDCEGCGDDPCIENFYINKNDDACQIEGVLNTTVQCNCNQITWSTEVYSRSGGVSFRLRLREGNAYVSGLNNIPLLRDTGIANPYPTSGVVITTVKESGYFVNSPSVPWERIRPNVTSSFVGTDEIITTPVHFRTPGEECFDTYAGENVHISTVHITHSIQGYNLIFENDCQYPLDKTTLSYTLKEFGGNGFYDANTFLNTTDTYTQYEVLSSTSTRNPIMRWYKSTTFTETGGQLIRKAYSAKVGPNQYRDAWLGLSDGVEIQHYYRLESDCSCTGKTYFKCEGDPSKLYYCNPDINDLNYNLTNCNTQIEMLSSNVFTICAANADYPQVYELHLNGAKVQEYTPVGNILTVTGTFTTAEPITAIQLKLQGVDCVDCYDVIVPDSGSLDVDVTSYNCDTNELNLSIAGGSGSYSITVDGTPWTVGSPIDLVTGSHTIYVEDSVTNCSATVEFEADCCAIFQLNSPDASVCSNEVGMYEFSVSGGEADYIWEVRDIPNGTILDSGTSSSETITADLSSYTGTSFHIKVTDNKACEDQDTVFVNKFDPVDIQFDHTNYCNGDSSHDIAVHVQTGKLPLSYEIEQGGSPVASGVITAATQDITIPSPNTSNYDFNVEDDNGCTLSQVLTLTEDACPDPVIYVDPESLSVCEGFDLIIQATIQSGTSPFMWTVTDVDTPSNTWSGTGNVYVDTGTTYSSTDGNYSFDIHVEDSRGKTDDLQVEYTVLDGIDPECINCGPEPNITLSSDVGWEVEPGDAVSISHSLSPSESQQWYVNGVYTGAIGTFFYPNTADPGTYEIYAIVEYSENCFTQTESQNLVISEPCECTAGINLQTGWGTDNGTTITTNSTSGTSVCVGGTITASSALFDCDDPVSVNWKLTRGSTTVTTQSGNSFSYNITVEGTYKLEISGISGDCVLPVVSFTKTFNVCRTCQITSDPISDAVICAGESVSRTLSVHNTWIGAPVKFITTVNGANYGTSPDKCTMDEDCDHTQLFSGLPAGTHTVRMRAYEYDEPSCVTDQYFDIVVRPISHEACRDCSDNTATINVVGQTGCFGSTCTVFTLEGQTVNLSASATGTPGGFSYQWSNSGGNVGSGSSVTVGPFDYGQSPSYTIKATDSEGCEFTKNININVQRDCSGSVTTSQNKNSACPGDSVTLSWNLSGLYKNTEYAVDVFRSVTGPSGPFQAVAAGLDHNGSYTFSMPNATYYWHIEANRGFGANGCKVISSNKTINLDSCVDCSGVVNSISVSQNPTCVGNSVNLTANVSGVTSGWTYTWYQGSGTGNPLGVTGLNLNGYVPASLPTTITVGYTKTGCTGGTKEITLTQASTCCDLSISPSTASGEICPTGSIGLQANASGTTSGWTFTWRKGTSPSGEIIGTGQNVTYTNITGTTVTLRATKTGCTPLAETLNFSYSASCCHGVVTSVNANPPSPFCCGAKTTLTGVIDQPGSGWTYQWKTSGGSNIGPAGLVVTDYELTSLPQTVVLHYTNAKCPSLSGTKSLVLGHNSMCCDGTVNISGDTSLCPGQPANLNTTVAPLGRTLTWRKGTSPSGEIIGTGPTLSGYFPSSLPETIRLWGTRDCCDPVYDQVTLTSESCCPSGVTVTKICNTNNIQVRVSGLSSSDVVQFNTATPIEGPHPGGIRTYTWSGLGASSVDVYVYRPPYCLKGNIDSLHWAITLIR